MEKNHLAQTRLIANNNNDDNKNNQSQSLISTTNKQSRRTIRGISKMAAPLGRNSLRLRNDASLASSVVKFALILIIFGQYVNCVNSWRLFDTTNAENRGAFGFLHPNNNLIITNSPSMPMNNNNNNQLITAASSSNPAASIVSNHNNQQQQQQQHLSSATPFNVATSAGPLQLDGAGASASKLESAKSASQLAPPSATAAQVQPVEVTGSSLIQNSSPSTVSMASSYFEQNSPKVQSSQTSFAQEEHQPQNVDLARDSSSLQLTDLQQQQQQQEGDNGKAGHSNERSDTSVGQPPSTSSSSSLPPLAGKIMASAAASLMSSMASSNGGGQLNNSTASTRKNVALQLLKPRKYSQDHKHQASVAEQQIIDQHARVHPAGSNNPHQNHRLLATKQRDNRIQNALVDSASGSAAAVATSSSSSSSSAERDLLSLYSFLGNFKSGISSRNSIVKAISDNKLARSKYAERTNRTGQVNSFFSPNYEQFDATQRQVRV